MNERREILLMLKSGEHDGFELDASAVRYGMSSIGGELAGLAPEVDGVILGSPYCGRHRAVRSKTR